VYPEIVRRSLSIALICLGALSTSTALAQEDGREQARQLFSQGVEASQNEDWETAASRFEQALDHYSAPTIEYNLASAYLELGRLGEAGDLVASILANPETDEETRALAEELDTHIGEQAGTLTIEVEGEANTGATVAIDGRELPEDRVGVPRHESPGTHSVVLTRTDASTEEQSVVVTQGSPARATFGPPLLGSEDGGGGSLFEDPVFWAVAGGAVLLTVIIIIAAVAAGPNEVGGDYEPAVLRF
jgi:hypothetical protein